MKELNKRADHQSLNNAIATRKVFGERLRLMGKYFKKGVKPMKIGWIGGCEETANCLRKNCIWQPDKGQKRDFGPRLTASSGFGEIEIDCSDIDPK